MKQPKRKCEKWEPRLGSKVWYLDWADAHEDQSRMTVYWEWFADWGMGRWHIPTKREAQDAASKINKILRGR